VEKVFFFSKKFFFPKKCEFSFFFFERCEIRHKIERFFFTFVCDIFTWHEAFKVKICVVNKNKFAKKLFKNEEKPQVLSDSGLTLGRRTDLLHQQWDGPEEKGKA
jgi:hypothetical protein